MGNIIYKHTIASENTIAVEIPEPPNLEILLHTQYTLYYITLPSMEQLTYGRRSYLAYTPLVYSFTGTTLYIKITSLVHRDQ